jgi:hypothetical protein
MDFMPFFTRYKELAEKETRCITITRSDFGVPRGEYGLIEYYCTDNTCDCRKVMLHVTHSKPPHQVLATIGYGWESAEFYTKWMHGDKEIGKQITGAYLETWGTQSQYAQNFLELVEEIALTDEYIDRIKRHYRLFKIYRASPSPSRSPKRKKRKSRSSSR